MTRPNSMFPKENFIRIQTAVNVLHLRKSNYVKRLSLVISFDISLNSYKLLSIHNLVVKKDIGVSETTK